MRLTGFLVVVNVAALAHGSSGTARWPSTEAASLSGRECCKRRVFNDRYSHSASAVAFLGRRQTTTATRETSGPELETVLGSLSAAGDAQQEVGGSRADTSGDLAEASNPRESAGQGMLRTFQDFWGHARDGTFALWTNFQISQDIRKRVRAGHAITYAEHAHLERGANDRRKLLQYVVAYAVSPKNFVYVVWYIPGLLPSTFEKPNTVRAKYYRLANDRATATLEALVGLETRLLKAETALKGKPRQRAGSGSSSGSGSQPPPLVKLFDSFSAAKKMEKLEMQREKVLKVLEAGSKREAFELFQEHMTIPAPTPPTSEESNKKNKKPKPQRLKLPPADSGVPNAAIKALGKGTGLSGWWHIAPGFYVRYCLSERLRDLGRSDDVLRTVSLESLSDRDLREACDARAIDVGNRLGGDNDSQELRRSLKEWLELTSAEVAAGSKLIPDTIFLPDRARLLGLGLNCLQSARQGKTAELSRKALLKSWQ